MAFTPSAAKNWVFALAAAASLGFSAPALAQQAPQAQTVAMPTSMPEVDALGRPIQSGLRGAGQNANWDMPSIRFRGSININLDVGYEFRYNLQPEPTNLDFIGFATVIVDRSDGNLSAQVTVDDPLSQLAVSTVAASAPNGGDFEIVGNLEDLSGNEFNFALSSSNANLPVVRVQDPTPYNARATIGTSGEFYGDTWSLGAAIAVDVSPAFRQQRPELSSASIFLNTRAGSFRVGRGVGLPYATRSFEVISGGGYSFADFGTYQASYVSPVIKNTRVGLLLGLQTRQAAISGEWQLSRGNNQFRLAAYADTARSIQGEAGYTRAIGPGRFVGATIYGGNDGSGESFFGLQGNLDFGRHSLQASATRVLSNNLTIVYGNETTGQPVLGIEVRDARSFNRQDQLNLEYRFQATDNVQFYANAEFIRHKFYGNTYAYGGGIRASF